MRNYQKVLAVLALSGMCLAAPVPSGSESARHKKKAAKVEKHDETAEQLRALKDQLAQQQSSLQQVQQQLQQTQQQLQQTEQQLRQTQQTAQQANDTAVEVQNSSNLKVQKVQSDLSDVKGAMAANTEIVKKAEKKVADLEHPNTLHYKGIRITPGGFIEGTGYYRKHATLSGQATPFQSIPVESYSQGTYTGTESGTSGVLDEINFTARDSRIAIRLDADPTKHAKLAGYYEMDFFGTSPTSNVNQTTSYPPRIRQAWSRVKFDNGWTITGGQMWNLITLNRKGTDADNSNLWIPNIIEAQYSVGYDWGRFAEIRVSKAFGPVTWAAGVVNASSLTQNGVSTAGTAGLASLGSSLYGNSVATGCSTTATATTNPTTGAITVTPVTTCTNSPTYSTNAAPDVVTKLAYDNEKIGHFEVKGLARFFRDRAVPTATQAGFNNTDLGWGVGAGAVVPVVARKVSFIAQGLYGKGISRYQDAGQYDFIVENADNNYKLLPVKAFSALAGFETHPTRRTELDTLFGGEYYYRTLYATTPGGTTLAGYGLPTATNTGCYYENLGQYQQSFPTATALPACTANNRALWNAKLYGYYDVFKGPYGTLRYGAEIDYIYRGTWSGTGGLPAGSTGLAPHGSENTAFVTMRYIIP